MPEPAASSTPQDSSSSWIPNPRRAATIVACYVVLSAAWIFLSDWFLQRTVTDPSLERTLEILNDWLFVAVTATLLGLALTRYFRQIRSSALQLKSAESELRMIGDNLPIGYVFRYVRNLEGKGQFVYVSAGVERVHGAGRAEVLRDAHVIFGQVDSRDTDAAAAALEESARNLTGIDLEIRFRKPGGETQFLHMQAKPTRTAKGIQWDGFAVDLTERKKQQAAIQESEALFRALFDHSPDGILLIDDQEMKILFGNPTMCRMLGYTPEELSALKPPDIHPESELHRVGLEFESLRRRSRHFASSVQVLRKDGSMFPADISASYVEMNGCRRAVGLFRDITHRKRAEASLRQSEERYRLLVENSQEAIYVAQDGRFKFVNTKGLELLGLDEDDVLGQPLVAFVPEADVDELLRHHQGVTTGSVKAAPAEFRYKTATGRTGWLLVNAVRIEWQGRPASLNFATEITERKLAEDALRESELRRTLALDAAELGTWEWDLVSGRHTWSECQQRLWGYEPGTFPGTTEAFTSRIHPDDLPGIMQAGDRSMTDGSTFQVDFRVVAPDGNVRWITSCGQCLVDSRGVAVRTVGVAWDITQRRQAEEALRASEERLRLALSAAQMGTYDWDLDSNNIVWSSRHEELMGYRPGEFDGTFEAFCRRIHPDDLPALNADIAKYRALPQPFSTEFRVVWPDGSIHWISSRGEAQMDAEGKARSIRGTVVEITELKNSEELLRNREEISSSIVGQATDAMVVIDGSTGRFVEFNTAAHVGLGYTRQEFSNVGISDIQAEHSSEVIRENLRRIREEGGVTFETRHRHRNGDARDVWVRTRRLDIRGRDFMSAVWTDITEWKRAERELRENEARLEALFEHSPVAIWEEDFSEVKTRLDQVISSGVEDVAAYLRRHRDVLLDCAAAVKVIRVNETSARLFCVHKEHLVRHLPSYFSPASLDVFAGELAALAGGQTRWESEIPIRMLDGRESIFWLSLSIVPTHEATWDRVVVSFTDISERKLMENLHHIQHKLTSALAATSDFDEGLKLCLQAALESGHMDCGGFYLLDEKTGAFDLRVHQGLSTEFVKATEHFARDSTNVRLVMRGEPYYGRISDFGAEEEALRKEGVRFLAVIPFCHEGRVIGCLNAGSRVPDDVKPVLRKGLETIASEAAQAMVRLKSEAALQEGLLLRREAEKIGRIGAWMVSPETDYLYWTEGIYEIVEAPLDYKPGLAEGLRFYDPESIPVLQHALERALRDGAPFDVEVGLTTSTGKHMWTEVRGLRRMEQGKNAYIMGTFQDITERKRAQRELDHALVKYRTLFDSFPLGITVSDRQGNIVESNREAERLLGISVNEQLGRHIDGPEWKIVNIDGNPMNPDDFASVRALREQRPVENLEMGIVKSQDETVWISVSAAPLPLPDYGVVIAYSDVGSRRRAEAELLFHRNLLEETGRTARVGGWQFNALTGEGTWTAEVARIHDLDEFLPTNRDIGVGYYTPDSQGRIRKAIDDAIRENVPYDLELELVSAKGVHKWVRTIGHPVMENGRVVRVQGSFQDITDHRQAQEALRAAEERYRSLIETSYDWVWEVDAHGRYTYASPRVQDIIGYSPEAVVGRTPFDFMSKDEAQRVGAVFNKIINKKQPFSGLENTNRHRDGRMVVVETSGVPIFGPDGSLIGYRGMDRDVTERKHLEEQFRQVQKLEAVGQLAGGVAHDFNNILAAILMQIGLLRHDPDLSSYTREALKELEVEAQRAATLTRQLLMFSRRSVLDVKVLNLNDVVEHLLKMLRRLIGEQTELNFVASPAKMTVEADAGMLEQVIMNLTVNARDAMPRGGRITIATQCIDVSLADARETPERRPGKFVCMSVQDTGSGMDEVTMRRIFDPFFTTKEAGKGTGLGLATVHGIVGQHKGWIEVQSAPGKGTTFRVLLPALASETAEAPTVQESQVSMRGHETILLVEDEPTVRKGLRQFLSTQGYTLLEASSGKEAVAVWEKEKPRIDLLLTDMVLPGDITGADLSRQFQNEKPDLKVIISSGYSSEIIQQGMPIHTGVVYLPKPYHSRTLGTMIRSLFDKPAGIE
jgi:two-component system, cell cycle sensor histidine kinase and response regulator CckA